MLWYFLLLWYIGTGAAFVFVFKVECRDENGEPCVWYNSVITICIAVLIWPYLFYRVWKEQRKEEK